MIRACYTVSFRRQYLQSIFHIDGQKVTFLIVSQEVDSDTSTTSATELVVSGARSKLIVFKLVPSLNELYVISVYVNEKVSIDGANRTIAFCHWRLLCNSRLERLMQYLERGASTVATTGVRSMLFHYIRSCFCIAAHIDLLSL